MEMKTEGPSMPALMIKHYKSILLASAVSWFVASCASAPPMNTDRTSYASDGSVSSEIVDKPSSERYQVIPGSQYLRPLPVRQNAIPEYPHKLLAKQLPPVDVVVRIIVIGKGTVESASIVKNTSEDEAFSNAVVAAVKTWTFIPLMLMTGNRVEPLPFTQDYRFTFKQINGRAVVESSKANEG